MSENLIKAKNVKTGETAEFKTQKEAVTFFRGIYGDKIKNGSIIAMAKQKKPYKGTWEVNYIGYGTEIKKVCKCCGKEFITNKSIKSYCSDECRTEYNTRKKIKGYETVAEDPKRAELVHKLVTMLAPYRTAK